MLSATALTRFAAFNIYLTITQGSQSLALGLTLIAAPQLSARGQKKSAERNSAPWHSAK
jgi:hypothetical protein